MINIRLASLDDIPSLERVFLIAKKKMRNDGNFLQWTEPDYPICYTYKDIEKGTCYVIEIDHEIHATFVFQLGEEVTYKIIDNGKWLNDEPYGTIHRIASDGYIKDIFSITLNYIKRFNVDIRTDTASYNKRMTHLINKHHFIYCGTIYIRDGSPRDAYQKRKEDL